MAARKRKQTKTSSSAPMDSVEEMDTYEEQVSSTTTMNSSTRLMIIGLVVVAIAAFGGYKYRYLLTPATVNGESIYIWQYISKLHAAYGSDQLNSMTTELMINQAVAQANVDVPTADIDAEVAIVEKEASSSGGLQAILDAQKLSMDEFRSRVKLQLSVKKILADKIKVTDQEVDDAYKKNKDFYKTVSEAEAKDTIRKQLIDQKFQTEVQSWLSDIKSKAKIDIKFPGLSAPEPVR